jgi:type I restriction enzyme S subunit
VPKYKFGDLVYNITEKRSPVAGDEELYIGLEHLDSGSLRVTRWGSKVALKGDKLVMRKGDILFGRRNTYLRRVSIAPHDGLFSAHGMILRAKTERINSEYLPFFIASDYFMDEAIRISVGSLSPTVNWKELKELEFTIPALEEQEKMVKTLLAANDLKEKYEELLAITDDLVKSQFIELFGRPEDNNLGWVMGTIRDIVSDVRYGSSRQASPDGKYPYIRMNNITYGGELDLTDLKRINIPDNELPKCTVRRGDVLFNRTNSKELVGKTCLYDRDETMVLAGFVIRVRMNDKATPEFLVQYMNLQYVKELLLSMCKAACGQANINAQELQNIPIYIPPMDIQKQFIALKQQTDKSKFELKQNIENINSLMRSLMRQDFTN